MHLLIPHGRFSDRYLVQAAQEMGHYVHFMCNHQEDERMEKVDRACLPDRLVPLASRFKLKLSHEDYQVWYFETIYKYVMKYKIDAILPSSSMDSVMNEVAKVNEEFGLPGILPEQAEFFRDKTVYLTDMAELGIRVPELYEIVEPSGEPKNYKKNYPCIAKPGLGSGGYGIYIADDEERLRWFFDNSDNPSAFTERALFLQDRDYRTYEPKSYLHFGFGGRYLIQEYLSGPCISLAGTVSDGVPQLDLAYDVGITSPPNCAEISFGWPSAHRNIEAAITRLLTSFSESKISFPDGAFMADAILHEGELWLVDFSPRMSSSGTKMLYHVCGNLSYAKNVIHATLGEARKMTGTNPTMPTYYSFIPFPKGTVTNVSYPYIEQYEDARIVEAFTPITGISRLFEMRNDVQVADRGWIIASSTTETRSDAQNLVEAFIRDIQYDIS